MVFDWFKKLGGGSSKRRARDTSDRNAVIRRVVAAAADDARKREESPEGSSNPDPSVPLAEPASISPISSLPKPESSRVMTPAMRQAVPAPPPSPPRADDTSAMVTREKIAQRAYEVWLRKGRPFGTAEQDWIDAEAELRAEQLTRPLPETPKPQ